MKNRVLRTILAAVLIAVLGVLPVCADGPVPTAGLSPEELMKLGPGYANTVTVDGTFGTAAAGRHIDPSRPMIALTYDDGPNAETGNRIMDVFLQYDQRCTFFVVGNRVANEAEEVKRMADNGFEIGNHSWSHTYYNKLNSSQISADVEKCSAAIAKYAGVTPKFCRTPGGIKGGNIMSSIGMPNVLWNIDTLDWKTRDADSTVNAVLGKVKDGDIILMHELYRATATATERLVPELVARGYQLVTVSELAQYKGVSMTAGKSYFSFP